ncbi:MAG: SpoIIE family protein phosphatase [Nocardiaceae bacterium]|nr:SpoIIE family protein phosphatase [Nocardiaceae bacterium]
MPASRFAAAYSEALRRYVRERSEETLEAGHELGRLFLEEGISLLEVAETHMRLLAEVHKQPGGEELALQFLLQTLAALDVATRGFLDETRQHQQQRARADDLAERDAFRTALVDSLQDGFFVADSKSSVVEINAAFGSITGYGAEGLPFDWPYPWVPEDGDDSYKLTGRRLLAITHKTGRRVWVAVNSHPVRGPHGRTGTYVGTIRDVTADQLARAREKADYLQARDISMTLQRAMLGPVDRPAGFAFRYEPAVSPLEVGGDWYDVVALSRNRIAVVTGDCVGRGLEAAVVMSQLRSASRALLLQDVRPAAVLEGLDAVAARIPGALCTTVCVSIIDPSTGEMSISSAGHMPVLWAGPNGAFGEIVGGRGVPLAAVPGRRRPDAQAAIPPGATVVWYTDGLVERRGLSIDDGISDLTAMIRTSANRKPDILADRILSWMRPSVGYDDDIAMVVYRQPPLPLALDLAATPDSLATIRQELSKWLRLGGVETAKISDIVLAVAEAATNAIEHAYRNVDSGRVDIKASVENHDVVIVTRDAGSWQPPAADSGQRGRGISLIRALTDETDISSDGDGTVVTMRVHGALA